jgi:hypothetical protein
VAPNERLPTSIRRRQDLGQRAGDAYVCRGATCSLPITAPAGLSQALAMDEWHLVGDRRSPLRKPTADDCIFVVK